MWNIKFKIYKVFQIRSIKLNLKKKFKSLKIIITITIKIMPRYFNYNQKKSSGRHLRGSSDNPLFEALDVVQTENRRYL